MIEKTLKELGLAENTVAVYKKLLELGSGSARQIAENMGMPRPSIYDHLNILLEQGLILERLEDGKKKFVPSGPKQLKILVKEKVEMLEQESKKVDQYFSHLSTNDNSEPKIRHFHGTEGVKQILKDLTWHENTEILSMWPAKEMIALLGKEYFENFNRRRIKNNNPIRGIWPNNKAVAINENQFLGVGNKHLRKLRIAPPTATWNMGHAVYGDKVSFISSRKETFGFIVQSKDFADLMRAQFEIMWKASKPAKYTSPKKDSFLESL